MKNKNYNFKYFSIVVTFIIYFYQINFVNAAIIQGGWNNSIAYRPAPILFLHGFAKGNPEVWNAASNSLNIYFDKYYPRQGNLPNSLSGSQYLERINFVNSSNSRGVLIDRNSSVDTYQIGDHYVLTGERNTGDPGWSDKVNSVIDPILAAYGTNKLILVCHSMGGLASREYLRQSGGNRISKLITIDTPHLGSELGNLAEIILISQKVGWFLPTSGWIFSNQVASTDGYLSNFKLIDIDGDAVRDMTPNSEFLQTLNSSSQPPNTDYFAIIGTVWWDPMPGDGVVSFDSQVGTGVLSLQNIATIRAEHGKAPLVASQGNPSPLLKFIDSTTPEIEITEPDPNANPIPEITTFETHVKGKVAKEYLPADTSLTITVTRQVDESTTSMQANLQPSDLWSSTDPYSPVAEFDVPITFWDNGTYTIKVVAKNPAKISSTEKTTQIKVTSNQPIISNEQLTGETYNKKPTIQARIYSPEGINIDLSSVVMHLDGASVNYSTTPANGGPDITISFTPSNNLSTDDPATPQDEGLHSVMINAKNVNGVAAITKQWSFEILDQVMCLPSASEQFTYRVSGVGHNANFSLLGIGAPTYGAPHYAWTRGMVKYDLSNAPASIRQARIRFVAQPTTLYGNPPISWYVSVHQILENWDPSTFDYNNPPSFGPAIDTIPVFLWSDDYEWDITSLAQGWLNGTISNYGVLFKLIPDQESGCIVGNPWEVTLYFSDPYHNIGGGYLFLTK